MQGKGVCPGSTGSGQAPVLVSQSWHGVFLSCGMQDSVIWEGIVFKTTLDMVDSDIQELLHTGVSQLLLSDDLLKPS